MSSALGDYVELRCQSGFSFLRGVSQPEELVAAASALGYRALALTDRCGLYGAARFLKAAARAGIHPIVGAELCIDGQPLLLLCENAVGYRHLCRLISSEKRRQGTGPQGALSSDDLDDLSSGLIAIVGGPDSIVAHALSQSPSGRSDAVSAVEKTLQRLRSMFCRSGQQGLFLELQVHFEREEDRRNLAMLRLSQRHGIPLVVSNDVRSAQRDRALLCDALDCVRQGVTLRTAGTRLLRNGERYLKPPKDMAALFSDVPQALECTLDIAARCQFSLRDLGYRFPDYPVPGCDPALPHEHKQAAQHDFLRARVLDAAPTRFQPFSDRVRAQLDRELGLIAKLGLSGYFLIVWDIIELCRARGILAQGRGSAANSAVCYALGITACDPLKMDLLFERFLSEERGEWPDIDLDLPSGAAREEIIQHLYRKYGPHGCAMTGSVITYRGRSAARDLGKVLELPNEAIDRLAKSVGHYEDPRAPSPEAEQGEAGTLPQRMREAGIDPDSLAGQRFATLWTQIQDLPRHFAQHPGGMIIAAGRLDEVVPLEPAAMPGRVVMQWDKDDVEDLGIVKIDLLGLGMLAALAEARALVPRHHGVPFDLHTLPEGDRATYDLIARGDTVGVFQIESRAQMAILPRTQPRTFYDLVVQVGLIRPGPIIGDMVHPYLKRRAGREPVRFLHPSLEPVLARTLGIPLFQEQIMRVAMIAGGFSGGQADELRRAMGGKHGAEKMARMVTALREGMAARGITGAFADEIVQSITAFAAYGFPESHAISFAYLTYASAYLKAHHPAAFYASLLNAWPMGFYHPATLVKDAQRHGVRVLPIEINTSQVRCTLTDVQAAHGMAANSTENGTESTQRGSVTQPALRMGLRYVRGLSQAAAEALVAEREREPYASLGDLRKRVPFLSPRDLATLAEIGAFARLDGQPSRRSALWQVSAMGDREGLLAGASADSESPLAEMTLAERIAADFHGASLSVGPHPVALLRSQLAEQGVLNSQQAIAARPGSRVRSAGLCIVRQRPPTAKGFCFLTLEDEAGLLNIIVPPTVYEAHRATLRGSSLVIVDGILQRQDGAVSIKADRLAALHSDERVQS